MIFYISFDGLRVFINFIQYLLWIFNWSAVKFRCLLYYYTLHLSNTASLNLADNFSDLFLLCIQFTLDTNKSPISSFMFCVFSSFIKLMFFVVYSVKQPIIIYSLIFVLKVLLHFSKYSFSFILFSSLFLILFT